MLQGQSLRQKKCKDCGILLKEYRALRCPSCAKMGKNNPMHGKVKEKHHGYKGGYVHGTLGYKLVHENGKKMYQHRVIMENYLGRKLKKNEVIHHINKIKTDNRIENLEVLTQGQHMERHSFERRKGEYRNCIVCGKGFYLKPYEVKNHVGRFCSISCSKRGNRYKKI